MSAHNNSFDQDNPQTHDPNWEHVYKKTLPQVFHFFCYHVGDQFLAEDLTSLTFEKAWANRDRFRTEIGTFRHWLFGIARNVMADHFRKQKNEVQIPHDIQDTTQNSPEIAIQRNSDYLRISKLLSNLPDRERELISLKYGAELTNRAIAELTGLSETNVGTILYRTVRKLRTEWEAEG